MSERRKRQTVRKTLSYGHKSDNADEGSDIFIDEFADDPDYLLSGVQRGDNDGDSDDSFGTHSDDEGDRGDSEGGRGDSEGGIIQFIIIMQLSLPVYLPVLNSIEIELFHNTLPA